MGDSDFTRRIQALEERCDRLLAERRQLHDDVVANREIIMELGNKQNALVDRLEEAGWLVEKKKILRVN